jgi:hypothetical protein
MMEPFFAEISGQLSDWCVNSNARDIPLLAAHFGVDAGIAGGAALCLETSTAL